MHGTTASLEDRLAALEARADHTDLRLARLGAATLPAPPRPRPVRPPAPAPARDAAPAPAPVPPPDPQLAIPEDRYAGRALAWTGAAATVLGLALLLVMAAARGWLDEEARVATAATFSLLLFLAGGRLYERRGRTDAAKAMTAAGIAGLNGALVVATGSYELLEPVPALVLALGLAAGMTALCLRWEARDLAVTTMLAALAAPVVLGAETTPVVLAFLAVAFAAVAWVCVLRDWPGLALAAFAIATPQWVAFFGDADMATSAALAVLTVFPLVGAAVAVGLEVRERRETLRHASAVLVSLNALVCAGVGYAVLIELYGPALAKGWLAGVAIVHLAGGAGLLRLGSALRLTALTVGVLLADVAAATVFDGVWLSGAWTISTLLFAGLQREHPDHRLVDGALAWHASLAVAHLLLLDAQPSDLHQGFDAAGLLSLSLVGAACLASAQIGRPQWRVALQALALAIAAYGTFAVCHGLALVATLALEAVALGRLAHREDAPAAPVAALGYLALALLAMLVETDAPAALRTGVDEALTAAAMVAACAGAAALLSHAVKLPPLRSVAAATLLYGASIELIAAFVDVQQGQVALSAFYALAGVALVVAGLLRDHRVARVTGLALLVAAAGKVLVYDLAELTEIYRVLSCTALGLLLLAGGFAWQRLRPAALEDLRAVATPLR